MNQKAIIPSDWEGEYCCYAVKWPKSPQWEAVLRGILTIARQGRFWNENTGNIVSTQSVINQTLDWNLQLWEVIMSCGDTGIADALQAIATALSNQQSGSGSNIVVSCGGQSGSGQSNVSYCFGGSAQIVGSVTITEGPPWLIYGTVPIPTLPESGVPDGYENEAEYDADKCAKAAKIVGDLIASLQNFSVLNLGVGFVGAAVIVACLVGAITVPAVTIPLLVWALLGNIGITTALGLLANYINEHKEEFKCYLYTGDNIEGIISLVADALDVAIAAIAVEGAVAVAIKSITLWLLNGDTLGILLTSDAKLIYPDADCSDCNPTMNVFDYCQNTVLALEEPWVIEVSGVFSCATSESCYTSYLFFNTDDEGIIINDSSEFYIQELNLDGFTSGCYLYQGNPADFLFYDKDQNLLGTSNTGTNTPCRIVLIVSSTPFTGTVTIARWGE